MASFRAAQGNQAQDEGAAAQPAVQPDYGAVGAEVGVQGGEQAGGDGSHHRGQRGEGGNAAGGDERAGGQAAGDQGTGQKESKADAAESEDCGREDGEEMSGGEGGDSKLSMGVVSGYIAGLGGLFWDVMSIFMAFHGVHVGSRFYTYLCINCTPAL